MQDIVLVLAFLNGAFFPPHSPFFHWENINPNAGVWLVT